MSKPVVYEHFGGKEGLYAVVVDREMNPCSTVQSRADRGAPARTAGTGRVRTAGLRRDNADGFRILVRDSGVGSSTGTFASLISDIAGQVEHVLAAEFRSRGFEPKLAPMYSQMLVGMVALTGQWWLDVRKPKKADVAAHLVNLAWHGLSGLEVKPQLVTGTDS